MMSETSQTSSENEKPKKSRGAHKRQVHNEVERRRKDKINNWISKIAELLPNKELHKQSKISILEQTVEYIKDITAERDKLLSQQCSEVQIEEIHKLKKNIRLIEEQNMVYIKLLQQANINLSSLPKKPTKYSNRFSEDTSLLFQNINNSCYPTTSNHKKKNSKVVSSEVPTVPKLCSRTLKAPIVVPSENTDKSSSKSINDESNVSSSADPSTECVADGQSEVSPHVQLNDNTMISCTVNTFMNSQGCTSSLTTASTFNIKASASLGIGGVTPALSPSPVMSTTHSSSVNDIHTKSVRMIILPSCGNFMQTPLVPAKDISNLSPFASTVGHTLPLIVPKPINSHCIIPSLNYANNFAVLSESSIINREFLESTEPLSTNGYSLSIPSGLSSASFILTPVSNCNSNSFQLSTELSTITSHNANNAEMVCELSSTSDQWQPINNLTLNVVPSSDENIPCSVTSSEGNLSLSSVAVTCSISTASVMTSENCDSESSVLSVQPKAQESCSSSNSASTSAMLSEKQPPNTFSSKVQKSEDTSMMNIISEKEFTHTLNEDSFITSVGNFKMTSSSKSVKLKVRNSPPSLQVLSAKKVFSLANQSVKLHSMMSFPSQCKTAEIPHAEVSLCHSTVNIPILTTDQETNDSSSISSVPTHVNYELPHSALISKAKCSPSSSIKIPVSHSSNIKELGTFDKSPSNAMVQKKELQQSSSNGRIVLHPLNENICLDPLNINNLEAKDKNLSDESSSTDSNSEIHPNSDTQRNSINIKPNDISSASEVLTTATFPVCITEPIKLANANDQVSYVNVNIKHINLSSGKNNELKSNTSAVSKCSTQLIKNCSNSESDKSVSNRLLFSTIDVNVDSSETSGGNSIMKATLEAQSLVNTSPDKAERSLNAEKRKSATHSSSVPYTPTQSVNVKVNENSFYTSENIINPTVISSLYQNGQLINISPPFVICQTSTCGLGLPTIDTLQNAGTSVRNFNSEVSIADSSLISQDTTTMTDPSMNSSILTLDCLSTNMENHSRTLSNRPESGLTIIKDDHSSICINRKKVNSLPSNNNNSNNFETISSSSVSQICKNKESNGLNKKRKSVMKATKPLEIKKLRSSDRQPSEAIKNIQELSSQYSGALESLNQPEISSLNLHNNSKIESESHPILLSNDILAKATESIFCSHIVDTPPNCSRSHEDVSNNTVEYSVSSLVSNNSIIPKPIMLSEVPTTEQIIESSSEQYHNIDDANNKQDELIERCSTGDLPPSATESIMAISSEGQNKEISSKIKPNKVRKVSPEEGSGTFSKKVKETLSERKDLCINYDNTKTGISDAKVLDLETISNKEKQDEIDTSKDWESGNCNVSSASNISHLPHLSESSCKLLLSNEVVFSNTPPPPPVLAEMFKDIPHNSLNLEHRNHLSMFSENQNFMSPDKSLSVSMTCVNSISDDYLQIPRMYLPAIPEPTTISTDNTSPEVSFSQTVVSNNKITSTVTLSDPVMITDEQNSGKKSVNLSQWNGKNINKSSLSFPNSCNSKNSENSSKLFSGTDANFEITQESTADSPFLFPQADRISCVTATNPTSIPSCRSFGNRFGVQNSFTSVLTPIAPPNLNFSNLSSGVSHLQQNYMPSSPPPLLSREYSCRSNVQINPFSTSTVDAITSSTVMTQTMCSQPPSSGSEVLSHSLCSLLKESSSQLSSVSEKRELSNKNEIQGGFSGSSVASSISQSKYSALSLISNQTFSELTSGMCSSVFSLPLVTSAPSCQQTISHVTSSHAPCSRVPRISLSYSAESLIQTQCTETEKDKGKIATSNNFPNFSNKKLERDVISNLHDTADTNVFMPLINNEISSQSISVAPMPTITSFPSFTSGYSLCDSGPSISLHNTVDRTPDMMLQLSNQNSFLKSANLNNDTSSLTHPNRQVTQPVGAPSLTKPPPNLSLSFENHGNLYNNCTFLQHPKSNFDGSRVGDSNSCFQSMSLSNGYSQTVQKQNCCHFPHQAVANHSTLIAETNLPIITTMAPIHDERGSVHTNRSSSDNFSQNASSIISNIFYDPTSSSRDINVGIKPSIGHNPQESLSSLGNRQNSRAHLVGNIQNQHKNTGSGKGKSKKVKQSSECETNINSGPIYTGGSGNLNNFSTSEVCGKPNISQVPNGYFKNHQTNAPSSFQFSSHKNKASEAIANSVMPPNPTFNPIIHPAQGESILNINFQPPNFTMNPLSRPPAPSLCCSCLTSPITTQTFTTAGHPVPNFNLSNILPDMGCSSSDSITHSPIKFQSINHILPPPPTSVSAPCQGSSTTGRSSHVLSHQTCGPTLYPPHPPVMHNTFNPLINTGSHGLNRSHTSVAAHVNSTVPLQVSATTFVPSQPPPFRNVIHSLNFTTNSR